VVALSWKIVLGTSLGPALLPVVALAVLGACHRHHSHLQNWMDVEETVSEHDTTTIPVVMTALGSLALGLETLDHRIPPHQLRRSQVESACRGLSVLAFAQKHFRTPPIYVEK